MALINVSSKSNHMLIILALKETTTTQQTQIAQDANNDEPQELSET